MIIVLKTGASKEDIQTLFDDIESRGLVPMPLYGEKRTVIAVIGDKKDVTTKHFASYKFVANVIPILKPYKLASKEGTEKEKSIITVRDSIEIGGDEVVIMAGPCSVESEEQLEETAKAVKSAGAKILRGGAFKPRTGPYSFEGLGEEGLKLLQAAGKRHDMAIVTEVMDVRQVDLVAKYSDIFQIGARNMQNYNLLREVGKTRIPVLLKRGMSATIKEWLLAAEYILSSGNPNVMLCERGIRTFEQETRNTFGVNSIPLVKELSHLPIIADPSHAAGKRSLVPALAKAGIAAGADGLIIEVHPHPEQALSDGDQSMYPNDFADLIQDIKKLATAVDRTL